VKARLEFGGALFPLDLETPVSVYFRADVDRRGRVGEVEILHSGNPVLDDHFIAYLRDNARVTLTKEKGLPLVVYGSLSADRDRQVGHILVTALAPAAR